MLTIAELTRALLDLGVVPGGIVMLHSSVVSLGPVEKGPEGVIQAFLDALGPEGTLVVPVFGKLGVITELVRARKDAVISDAPVGTLAAVGKKAAKLMAGHLKADTAHGKGSPFVRIAQAGGQICLLGVDLDRNTMLHTAEALLELPYLRTVQTTSRDKKGKEITRSWRCYPGPHRDFIGLDYLLRQAGVMKVGRISNAQVRLLDAQAMLECLQEVGEEDPAFALCRNPSCRDCVLQRAAIRRDLFARETFRLAASSRLCGRYLPEMVEHLQEAGIDAIELDYLQGRPMAFLPAGELKKAVEELQGAGLAVTSLRVPALPGDVEKSAAGWREAGISRIVLPLGAVASPEVLSLLARAGHQVLLGNQSADGQRTRDALARFFPEGGRHLAFSPVEFARCGEHPFLQSWRTGRFIHTIGQLDLADAQWDGTPMRLAQGNGEVKELLSILRCSSFSGDVVLGGGSPYPGTLQEAAEQLQHFLE
ncbi:MAG: AAC(3) family N-acetyltransferase [Oligosphaeraceae bacterium]